MSTLLLDVDHCLAPFNQDAGTEKVKELLKIRLGKWGVTIGNLFGETFYVLDSIYHGKETQKGFDLKHRLDSYSIQFPLDIVDQDVNFMWSRELWLKYLSDEHRLELDGQAIMQIIEGYWEAISYSSKVYPQVLEYLQQLDNANLFVITGSDRRLVVENSSIRYDPALSERKKITRVQNQGLKRIIPEDHIIVGDPYDKPSQRFWEKVMRRTSLSTPSQGIVVDDSLPIVLSAIQSGFKGYVLDRSGFYKRKDVENQVDGYITEINQIQV